MKTTQIFFAVLLTSLFSYEAGLAARRQVLASPQGVTVSGVSAGGYLAVQLHVAFSKIFSGSASIAGGTYWCAEGNAVTAQLDCMRFPKTDDPSLSLNRLKEYESEGLIDSSSNLKNDRVVVFSSQGDSVVNFRNSLRLENFFKALIPESRIVHLKHKEAAHGFPTLNFGKKCGEEGMPWLQNCGYDLAGQLLAGLYGPLQGRGPWKQQNLSSFSQKEFDPEGNAILGDRGWIYVPTSCRQGRTCRLHVALHGCEQSPEFIEDTFVKHAGYNEWAESNHIIVLYPQTTKTLMNPKACWDWFGLTGPQYATKAGPQMKALVNMVRMFIPSLQAR